MAKTRRKDLIYILFIPNNIYLKLIVTQQQIMALNFIIGLIIHHGRNRILYEQRVIYKIYSKKKILKHIVREFNVNYQFYRQFNVNGLGSISR